MGSFLGFLCVGNRWNSTWTLPGAQLCSNSLPVFQQKPMNISRLAPPLDQYVDRGSTEECWNTVYVEQANKSRD